MSALAVPFEDKTDFDGGVGYVCPNENVEHWRSLVKGKHIRRAAGIASGGEVGYFALLPTVREELVLVDHAYASLRYAMQKYLVIKHCGFDEAQRLFTKGTRKEVQEVINKIRDAIPAKVRNARDSYDYDYYGRYDGDRLARVAGDNGNYCRGALPAIWNNVPKRVGQKVVQKLDKVTFVHGDFRSLEGPFDLFYLSNAWESGNGNRGNIVVAEIDKLVKRGGHVLITGREPYRSNYMSYSAGVSSNPKTRVTGIPEDWECLDIQKVKSPYGMAEWQYELYQTGKAA